MTDGSLPKAALVLVCFCCIVSSVTSCTSPIHASVVGWDGAALAMCGPHVADSSGSLARSGNPASIGRVRFLSAAGGLTAHSTDWAKLIPILDDLLARYGMMSDLNESFLFSSGLQILTPLVGLSTSVETEMEVIGSEGSAQIRQQMQTNLALAARFGDFRWLNSVSVGLAYTYESRTLTDYLLTSGEWQALLFESLPGTHRLGAGVLTDLPLGITVGLVLRDLIVIEEGAEPQTPVSWQTGIAFTVPVVGSRILIDVSGSRASYTDDIAIVCSIGIEQKIGRTLLRLGSETSSVGSAAFGAGMNLSIGPLCFDLGAQFRDESIYAALSLGFAG